MPDIPFYWLPVGLVLGTALGWALSFESRRLAHEDKAAHKQEAKAANERALRWHSELVAHKVRVDPVGAAPRRRPTLAPTPPEPAPAERVVDTGTQRLVCPVFDHPTPGPDRYIVHRKPVDPLPDLPGVKPDEAMA